MSSESLVGGVYDRVSPETQQLLDAVLGTTGNTSVSTLNNGSVLVVGGGPNGEAQGALVMVPSGPALTGVITLGGTLEVSVIIPPEVSFTFTGPAAVLTPDAAQGYVSNLLNGLVPDSAPPELVALRNSVVSGIEALTGVLGGRGESAVVVRFINLSSGGSTPNGAQAPANGKSVSFTGDPSVSEVLTFLMLGLKGGQTLELSDVAAAALIGAGNARVMTNTAAAVSGDVFNQVIEGAGGADTLIGGGGADTLIGGGGADLFGFTTLKGNVTISDFNARADKLLFLIDGVSSVADLAPFFTGLELTNNGAILRFGAGQSITLVGVQAADLTVDLLKFNL